MNLFKYTKTEGQEWANSPEGMNQRRDIFSHFISFVKAHSKRKEKKQFIKP